MGKVEEIVLNVTKAGTPYLTERGGGCSHTGNARIIAGRDGKKKQAFVIYTSGHLSNNDHAIIPVEPEDIIVTVWGRYDNMHIKVRLVVDIRRDTETPICKVRTVYEYADGQWIGNYLSKYFEDAVKACIEKYKTYHCRTTFWCLEPDKEVV